MRHLFFLFSFFSRTAGGEAELTMHDGTIRDLCFVEDLSNHSSLLISGGAGDCKIYVTDCETATPFQALSGHSGRKLILLLRGELSISRVGSETTLSAAWMLAK